MNPTGKQSSSDAGLVASRRHTFVFLVVLFIVSVAGYLQARQAPSAKSIPGSHVGTYIVLIGVQLLWLRYIQIGMRARGRSILEFLRPKRRDQLEFLRDSCWAIIAFVATQLLVRAANYFLGGLQANAAFLLPHGLLESFLWILVSVTAGFSEEIAFRGYLQQQLTVLAGYAFPAIALQAVIFGSSHGYQGWKATLVAIGYGLLFGVIAWRLKSVRATAWAHVATDVLAGLR